MLKERNKSAELNLSICRYNKYMNDYGLTQRWQYFTHIVAKTCLNYETVRFSTRWEH